MIFTGTNIRIEIDTEMDLSSATDATMRWRRRGQSGEWQAQTDGETIYYDTQADDLDVPSVWEFQGVFTLNGKTLKTEIVKQTINSPIPKPTE